MKERLSGKVISEVKESKVIQYIEKNFIGKKLYQIKYHKYFFGNETQVVLLPEIDKKKKKKHKRHSVKHSSKIDTCSPIDDEEIKSRETNNDTEKDEVNTNALTKSDIEIKTTISKDKPEVEIVTIEKSNKVVNKEEIVKEYSEPETSQSIPHDTKTEDANNESTKAENMVKKKKHNGKSNSSKKAKSKTKSAIKKEYEELKMNTIKFFKQSTLVPDKLKPKKSNKTKQEDIMNHNEAIEGLPYQKRTGKYWQYKTVTYRKKNDLPVKEEQEYELFYYNDMPMQKLNEVIDDVMSSLNLYNEMIYAAQEVIIKVIEEHAIKCLYNNNSSSGIKASLYGSVATGLALEDSDIDIVLNNVVALSKEEYINDLLKLGDYLKEQSFVKSANTITAVRVPVIKLVLTSY